MLACKHKNTNNEIKIHRAITLSHNTHYLDKYKKDFYYNILDTCFSKIV